MAQTDGWQILPRQRQDRRCFGAGEGQFPGFSRFNGIRRAEDIRIGRGATDRQMFDGLMSWAVFAQTNTVMRHNKYGWNLHQGRQPHRGACVIGKAHKSTTIGAHAPMQRHSVHRRGHTMFANAPIHIAARAVIDIKGAHIFGARVV